MNSMALEISCFFLFFFFSLILSEKLNQHSWGFNSVNVIHFFIKIHGMQVTKGTFVLVDHTCIVFIYTLSYSSFDHWLITCHKS